MDLVEVEICLGVNFVQHHLSWLKFPAENLNIRQILPSLMQLFYFESVSCINTKLKNNDNIEYSAKRKSIIPVTITVLTYV